MRKGRMVVCVHQGLRNTRETHTIIPEKREGEEASEGVREGG